MSRIPLLARLARQAGQDPEVALERVLGLVCEQLGMTTAVVGVLSGDEHRVTVAVDVHGERLPAPCSMSCTSSAASARPTSPPITATRTARRSATR